MSLCIFGGIMASQRYVFRVAHAARPDDPALIALGDQQTLEDLHYAIQSAFHWDADHLYSFFMSGRPWDRSTEYAATDEGGWGAKLARRGRIDHLGLQTGSTFLYLFDYGDEHHFSVRVEEISQTNVPPKQARIERAPANPPAQYEGFDEDEDDWDAPLTTEQVVARIEEINRLAADEDLDYDWGGDGSDPHEPVRIHVEAALVPADGQYPPPVDELKRLGDPRERTDIPGRIAGLGLTQEHVPDLVRMTRDRALNTAMSDSDEIWAPIHALHALEQFDVTDFVSELIPLFDVDSDWFGEDLPDVLRKVGAPALEPLSHYLHGRTHWIYGRARAANALTKLAEQQPELREGAVQILVDELEHAGENAPEMNGFLLSELLHLDAVEALPVIRRAFEQDAIDESIAGDWGTVLDELGQTPDPDDPLVRRSRERWDAIRASMWPFARRTTEQPAETWLPPPMPPEGWAPAAPSKKSSKSKQKTKRKMAAASRKVNKSKKKKRK
jgi:hypothetical protein